MPSLHRCAFGPLTVAYDDRVLTPRPWTVAQSEWAAELADDLIVELCAGAGQIGLAAAVLADADLLQVEADPVAAGYAARNAEAAGWRQRTDLRVAPMQSALQPVERFGLIIADPPYLPTAATARWPEDPVTAIDGGPDGFDLVRDCLGVAAAHLTVPGTLVLQVAGPPQADRVGACLRAGLAVVDTRTIDSERALMRIDRI
ncbi:MAG: RsmD family RNA methyltransferase [Microlunatus sp.]|nr:RsmD family RNA methyltransferase [Microlunatus sp.]